MSTRGAGRAPRRARQATFAALGGLAALSLAACGEEDFANEPRSRGGVDPGGGEGRPQEVVVSPDRFGAGLVNFTVANFSDSPVTLHAQRAEGRRHRRDPSGRRRGPEGRASGGQLRGERRRGSERPAGHDPGRAGARELQGRAAAALAAGSGLVGLGDQRLDPLELRPHRLDHRVQAGAGLVRAGLDPGE